jgi:Spy/CpxP family protein refolding chaperone
MRSTHWAALSLASLLVLGGCSSHHHHGMADGAKGDAYWQKGQQDMAGLIDRTVKDPAKAQQVKSIVGEIVTELKAGREQERAYHRQLYTLNSSYTASPEEFTKILDEGNNQRMRTSAKILALRFKMKELMTADEWKALSDQMLSYSSRYQHGGAGAKTGY